ncbi:unnamed protein product [Cylicostephanus goldi]|uniref:Uncharacterized protein n=1 Tax=Cylicostephanus goldi TaxID=71465 RepID=A0A3P6RMI6_CYLGO|nr:unnamed protein product [Cylicostephanus goldi]
MARYFEISMRISVVYSYEAAISKNGKHSLGKAKESKNIAKADGGDEAWYEIKAMRMDKKEASLPDRNRAHVARKHKHVQLTTKLEAATTKKPQQLNFTRNVVSTVTEQHEQLNFTTKLDVTTPKNPMQLNLTSI